jgi:hypothetical protein
VTACDVTRTVDVMCNINSANCAGLCCLSVVFSSYLVFFIVAAFVLAPVPHPRRLVAGFSPRWPRFDPRLCGICGERSGTGTVFLQILPFHWIAQLVWRLATG